MLMRTALWALLVQVLVVAVVSSAVPRGGAWMTTTGFVTTYYDTNIFAVKLVAYPWTDPTVYLSVQTLAQMAALALAFSALLTLARTNPWHHGVLPDSTPPPKERPSDKAPGEKTAAGLPRPVAQGPNAGPATAPAPAPNVPPAVP